MTHERNDSDDANGHDELAPELLRQRRDVLGHGELESIGDGGEAVAEQQVPEEGQRGGAWSNNLVLERPDAPPALKMKRPSHFK